MIFNESGIVTLTIEEQSANVYGSITVTFDGISTSVRLEHPLKAKQPILSTVFGIEN